MIKRVVCFLLALLLLFQTVSCAFEQEGEEKNADLASSASSVISPTANLTLSVQYDQTEEPSTVPFAAEIDYEALFRASRDVTFLQDINASSIETLTYLYFSPDEIASYVASQETEEEFFGFTVAKLCEEFGADVTLTFTPEGGVYKGVLVEEAEQTVGKITDKSWLKKIGIGVGVIFIGATLTAATGGSFSCCFMFVLKSALAEAGIASALALTAQTISGKASGLSYKEAFLNSMGTTKDVFAENFLAASVVGSLFGIGKSLCFPAGTYVAVVSEDGGVRSVLIEDVAVGDCVFSWSIEKDELVESEVTERFTNTTQELCHIKLSDQKSISCTPMHPFFVHKRGYVEAAQLRAGDQILSLNGENVIVEFVAHELLEAPIETYNLAIRDYHAYFVGVDEDADEYVLTHNICTTESSLRAKAKKDLIAEYLEDYYKNGFNPLNLTDNEIAVLQTGKLKKIKLEVAHIYDVSLLKMDKTRIQYIGDYRNTVLLRESRSGSGDLLVNQHRYVHRDSWRNFTDTDRIREIYSNSDWIKNRIQTIKRIIFDG